MKKTKLQKNNNIIEEDIKQYISIMKQIQKDSKKYKKQAQEIIEKLEKLLEERKKFL